MNLLFLAKYPIGKELRDGMSQRVAAIDLEFEKCKRKYLRISYRGGYSEQTITPYLTAIEANIFRYPSKIFKLLRDAETIYIHSVYNAILFFLLKKRKHKVILDLHGVVPEELILSGKTLKGQIFSFVEKHILKKVDYAIAVTNSMIDHYKRKYPNNRDIRYIVKPIYPTNTIKQPDRSDCLQLCSKYGIKENDTVIIYSGNTQKWQNIDLMIECIRKISNDNYVFLLLTQNPEEIRPLISNMVEQGHRIFVESVAPQTLPAYYKIAHYGFLLRDDIIVNRVAAPTKMIEYLGFGITPIIKSPNIGDWYKQGYEYIDFRKISQNLLPKKSNKNTMIAEKNIAKSTTENLVKIITK